MFTSLQHTTTRRALATFGSWSRLLILGLSLAMMLGTTGCKGKKKKAEEERARIEALAAAERESYLNGIRSQLNGIINYSAADLNALAAKEAELASIDNLEDWKESDILVLIKKARYHLEQERERLTQQLNDTNTKPPVSQMESDAMRKVNQAFSAIANAGSVADANAKIQQAQSLFSSADVPVLIIISQAGDLDRPTTISRYLNYLKDQQKNPNVVERVTLDSQGRIRELELIKSQLRP